jgi:8-oxo-dGTP diphosphatase
MEWNEQAQKWESIYWHPAVAVDAVVFGYDEQEKELSVLLIERGEEPFKGMWALPGGFITQKDESAEAAVKRELHEETNVTDIYLKQFKAYSKADRDPRPNERVISIAFLALVVKKNYQIKGGYDAKEAQWHTYFTEKENGQLPQLAFDHQEIVKDAFECLQKAIHYEPLAFQLLNKEAFTMPQLHNIYKTILMPPDASFNVANDSRNFMKKMLHLGYVKKTGKFLTGLSSRPPELYSFDEKEFWRVKDEEMRKTL